MLEALPAALRAFLADWVSGAQRVLGDELAGAYLVGSFALGAGDAHSDVDVVAVTRHPVDEATLAALNALHARLYALPTPWAQHLEGAYMSVAALRADDPEAWSVPYLDNGAQELIYSTHTCSWVDRWVLRQRGLVLVGPPPERWVAVVPPTALRAEVRGVMSTWGDQLLTDPARLATRWSWPFAVLSFCRMLQTLETGEVGSKPEGRRWALATLPARWHDLIQRAWVERDDPWSKVHLPADAADIAESRRFVAWAMARV